jgi:hypothetical protein
MIVGVPHRSFFLSTMMMSSVDSISPAPCEEVLVSSTENGSLPLLVLALEQQMNELQKPVPYAFTEQPSLRQMTFTVQESDSETDSDESKQYCHNATDAEGSKKRKIGDISDDLEVREDQFICLLYVS